MKSLSPTARIENPSRHQRPGTSAAGRLSELVFSTSYWIPIAIFALAFLLRCFYNCVQLEHRVCYFGDAYNYLRTGTCMLDTILSAKSFNGFLASVLSQGQSASLLQSMTSMRLPDRLLMDGPVYPTYLAIIEWLSGVNPSQPVFESHCVQLCLFNSFVDSLTCVLTYWAGRLAFNRSTALLSGILLAVYPPSVINTQHCYSEPFAYFLLSCLTCLVLLALLRHSGNKMSKLITWTAIGLCSGLVMLSKASLFALPPLIAVVLLTLYLLRSRILKETPSWNSKGNLLARCSCLAAGLLIVLGPWIFYTHAITGTFAVLVNRAPYYNLFVGNNTKTDGWRIDPYNGTIATERDSAIQLIAQDIREHPFKFFSLQLKKVARLWSGVWNDFQYPLLGINLPGQALIHQLLLLLASIGFTKLLLRPKHWPLSHSFAGALLLGSITLFHFIYVAFEPQPRYAITAIPSIILLAAYALASGFAGTPGLRWQVLRALLTATFVFWFINLPLGTYLAGFLPPQVLDFVPIIQTILCTLVLIMACRAVSPVVTAGLEGAAKFFAKCFLWGAGASAALVMLACTIGSYEWKGWSTTLSNTKQAVEQDIYLPPSIPKVSDDAFAVMDIDAQALAPQIKLTVNGVAISDPVVPFAQLQADNTDVLNAFSTASNAMGTGLDSLRQWWAIPVNLKLLKFGQINRISISPCNPDNISIWGDYSQPGVQLSAQLPSLNSFSYIKGLCTFDNSDPRILENTALHGQIMASRWYDGKQWSGSDLSPQVGNQFGTYRIHLVMAQNNGSQPSPANTKLPLNAATIDITNHVLTVTGNNPLSMVPAGSPFALPKNLPADSRFNFSCQLKTERQEGKAFVALMFSGQENGKTVDWYSLWQPLGIETHKQWSSASFSDSLPERIVKLENPRVKVLVSPFLPDVLFLKRKQALKCELAMRQSRLSFYRPLSLPKQRSRQWLVY